MKPAIKVETLSKRFQIGARQSGEYRTLRESIMSAAMLKSLARRLKRRGASGSPSETDLWALNEVSFTITPGESVGIIGRNGAGKSTLLKVLSRITPPTRGSVEINGRVGSLLEVGTGFHPELTGRENVYLNGAIIGMTRSEITKKFDAIVAFAEVDKFIDTPVKRYSSGMYVRLAFSVAAHMEPDILLIDEVLSVGDLAFQRKCMDHAKAMLERDTTLLFVSHNMFTIKALCERAICLASGRVVSDGETAHVTRLYDQESQLDMAGWAQNLVGSDPQKCPIFIKKIEILDEAGRPSQMFDFGARVRLRLHYFAQEAMSTPNFNVCFQRSDGIDCCNYNTTLDGFATGTVRGEGVIEMLTPPIKLVAELYSVQVLVWDAKFQRLYCAQQGSNFHVRHDLLSTEFGVFHENAQWRWGDEAELPSPRAIEPADELALRA
ncbi:hypothetical protein BH09PLA1_BH09PLA1_12480 [soil metagenome]